MADANCGTLRVVVPFSDSDVTVSDCDLRFGTTPRLDDSWTGGAVVSNDGPESADVEIGTYANGERLGVTDTTIGADSTKRVDVPSFDRAEELADLAGVSIGESFDFGYAVERVNGSSVDREPTTCGSVTVIERELSEDDIRVSDCSITRGELAPGETTEIGATVENTSEDATGSVIIELVLDGSVEADREIRLGPGDTARNPFEVDAEAFSADGTDVTIRATPGTKN